MYFYVRNYVPLCGYIFNKINLYKSWKIKD